MPKKAGSKPAAKSGGKAAAKKAPARKTPVKIKVDDFDFALADINAGLIPKDMPLPDCLNWASCCWLPSTSEDENHHVAGLTVNTRLDWQDGLLVSLKYIADFIVGDGVTLEQIEDALHEIMVPVWNDATYVTSFITERFIGVPIITPPEVEMIEFEEYEEESEDDE